MSSSQAAPAARDEVFPAAGAGPINEPVERRSEHHSGSEAVGELPASDAVIRESGVQDLQTPESENQNPEAARTSRGAGQPGTQETAKVEVENLSLWYGKVQALRNVDVTIPPREITALIGPSGCGKSTFLRCLNRMNDLVEGVRIEGGVRVDGEDVHRPSIDLIQLRKKVGMVFQRPNPFPMSIFDNVAYGPRIHGQRNRLALQDLVRRSLEGAALWDEVKDKLNAPALSLSGGQQQRLCIARLLAVEPEVLLMDEPCSALDPISTFKVEELMLDLKQKYTIVLVTHNMYQASRVSRYTGFFLNGEMVEFGDTAILFERPREKRTDDYIRGRFG